MNHTPIPKVKETDPWLATDTEGNVYVVGRIGVFYDTSDAFVIKLDRDGSEQWRRQPGTALGDRATSVATDADGNVYVAGSTNGALGGTNKRYWDPFVIKFDRDGRIVWKNQPGTPGGDGARGVATGTNGSVYVVGETDGSLPGNVSRGRNDSFLIKYGPNGPR